MNSKDTRGRNTWFLYFRDTERSVGAGKAWEAWEGWGKGGEVLGRGQPTEKINIGLAAHLLLSYFHHLAFTDNT